VSEMDTMPHNQFHSTHFICTVQIGGRCGFGGVHSANSLCMVCI
jgi:hypothetical protein